MKKIIRINNTELNDFFLLNSSLIDLIMEELFVYLYHGYTILLEQHYVEVYGGEKSKYLIKAISTKKDFLNWYIAIIKGYQG